MTDLFQANGDKHEANTGGETREEGATRKKKRSSLRSRLAFASVHLENEKNSRRVLQAMTFNYRTKVSNLVLSGNVTCFLSRGVVQRIGFYYIYNNDHAPFNG